MVAVTDSGSYMPSQYLMSTITISCKVRPPSLAITLSDVEGEEESSWGAVGGGTG